MTAPKDQYEFGFVRLLRKNLEAAVDEATREQILEGSERIKRHTKPKVRAEWAKEVIDRMDDLLEEDQCIRIRERCACSLTSWRLIKMKRLYKSHPDLDDFLAAVEASGLMGKSVKREGDIVRVNFGVGHCVCSFVRASPEPISITYCHCCKGHLMGLFQAAWEKPVRMDVVKTCISGSDDCEFILHLD